MCLKRYETGGGLQARKEKRCFLVYPRFPGGFSAVLSVIPLFSSTTSLACAALTMVWIDDEPPFNCSFSL